jgi:hypothetical protein
MTDVFVKPILRHETGSLLTTVNTYVVISTFEIRGFKYKTFVLKAVTNDLEFLIEFSADRGVSWVIRLTDIDVAAAAVVVRETESNAELRGLWTNCRVSVRPNVAATHGTGSFEAEFGTL